MPKILYAFQGTGNGHSARALELIPRLQKIAQVDTLISGRKSDLDFPFNIDYRLHGVSFSYNKSGGLSYLKTAFDQSLKRVRSEIDGLDLSSYDLVINDFESISARAARKQEVPILGLSHQASFLSDKSPRPKRKDLIGEWILKNYAPVNDYLGFHFQSYDQNIKLPIIRKAVRESRPEDHGHFTVYLPAYGLNYISGILEQISNRSWHIFSKEVAKGTSYRNLVFHPISADGFLENMATAQGVLCSAGFETPSEALFFGKKLFVIPIKGQYEQYCNAQALMNLGVSSIRSLHQRGLPVLRDWAYSEEKLQLEMPDQWTEIQNQRILPFLGISKEEDLIQLRAKKLVS